MSKICIVGAGAIGGYVGAHFAANKIDVTLIDAWAEHVDAMRRTGISVEGVNGAGSVSTPVNALHISDVPQLVRTDPFDIVFIAVKSYDTLWATQLILPYMAASGCIVSLQNSINEDAIASVAGWSRTLGCSLSTIASELVAPGHIVRNSPLGDKVKIGLRIGEVHGRSTPRAHEIARLLSCADSAKVTSNLWGERWSKLVINAMRNGVSALTGMSGKERDNDDVGRELSIRLGSSCVRVGKAMGLHLEPVGGFDLDLLGRAEGDSEAMALISNFVIGLANSRNDHQRPSMGQDIRKGRRTETDSINGLVARRGAELGVDVRLHDRVNKMVKRIEIGEIAPSPSLLDEIMA
jgi:2-dehydropantoate 2-reductase